NFNSAESGAARMLGGGLALRQRLASGWFVGISCEKLSVRARDDTWTSCETTPLAVYGTIQGPGFEIKAGGERGAFQASVAADLGQLVAGLGLQANAAVDADGTWRVTAGLSGTF